MIGQAADRMDERYFALHDMKKTLLLEKKDEGKRNGKIVTSVRRRLASDIAP